MRKLIKVCAIAMFIVSLIGCSNVKFEEYCGEDLNIGVIGEIPKVREDIID